MIELPAGFTTRYAPAPTGFLHLGHVANALFVWGLAERHGGRVLLRVEDHDRTRCRPEYERAILEDLEWLGFEADAPPVRQSERNALYETALLHLESAGLVYVCDCTRADIHGSVPVAPGEEAPYPGTCRARALAAGASSMRRVRLDPRIVAFDDLRLGRREQSPARQCGDLLARDRAGCWTYQFAVVVDDVDQRVDVVIRGEDLLESTGRQIQLAALLGCHVPLRYFHHPLVMKPDGAKLSKSNRDSGVRDLRYAGLSPARVRGLAAASVGLLDAPRDLERRELAALLESANVSARKGSTS